MSDTKQINVRLPVELHKALDDHKVRTGEEKSDVIRRGILIALHRARDEAIANGAVFAEDTRDSFYAAHETPKPLRANEETVELAAWLAGRTRMPRAIMRRRISEGRVKVDGEVFTADRLGKSRLASVTLDGDPV